MAKEVKLSYRCSDCGEYHEAEVSKEDFEYIKGIIEEYRSQQRSEDAKNKITSRLEACFLTETDPATALELLRISAGIIGDIVTIVGAGKVISDGLGSRQSTSCSNCGKKIEEDDVNIDEE